MSDPSTKFEIVLAAELFYVRSGASGIVVITEEPERLVGQFSSDIKLYVVVGYPQIRRYEKDYASDFPNAVFVSFSTLAKDFLEDKILVCVDYLDRFSLHKIQRKRIIKRIGGYPLISMVAIKRSTMPVTKLRGLFPNQRILTGVIRKKDTSTKKDQEMVLAGRLIDVKLSQVQLLPVLAVIHAFNEEDIIQATVQHLLDEGVDVHIIDNWSTDNTGQIIKSLSRNSRRVTYEIFPKTRTNKFELEKLLKRVTGVAKEKSKYAWVLLNDADEIRWSPWPGITLQEAFSFIDSRGYNSVDYTVFNFFPTREGFNAKDNPVKFFNYGEFSGIPGHFVQVKAWRNHRLADVASSGGHHVLIPNQKVFPLKFLLGHYPLRSTSHARTKIFEERQPRYSAKEKQRGWHVHYSKIPKQTSFIQNPSRLIDFSDNSFNELFLLERVSGVGIPREVE